MNESEIEWWWKVNQQVAYKYFLMGNLSLFLLVKKWVRKTSFVVQQFIQYQYYYLWKWIAGEENGMKESGEKKSRNNNKAFFNMIQEIKFSNKWIKEREREKNLIHFHFLTAKTWFTFTVDPLTHSLTFSPFHHYPSQHEQYLSPSFLPTVSLVYQSYKNYSILKKLKEQVQRKSRKQSK